MPEDIPFIEHFPSDHRASLSAFARQSPRLADLAQTHPVAFVALATGYGDPKRRMAAIEAVVSGRRLRAVCDLAGIPHCLRCVPPEFCPVPLPPADWSDDASPILAQFIPDDPIVLRNWVPAIFFANGAAGEPFAMWLAARHELLAKKSLNHQHLLPLAMYVWFAQHPQYELHTLLPASWTSKARSRRALEAVRAWLHRVRCQMHMPGWDGQGSAAKPLILGSFKVVELTDYVSLLAEQRAMDNCLDRYAGRIASGRHAMFSLRTYTGKHFANFEIVFDAKDEPQLHEIKGRSNAEVPEPIRHSVAKWAISLPELLLRAGRRPKHIAEPDVVFTKLVAPYVESHETLLKDYDLISLKRLYADLAALEGQLGIKYRPLRCERMPDG